MGNKYDDFQLFRFPPVPVFLSNDVGGGAALVVELWGWPRANTCHDPTLYS